MMTSLWNPYYGHLPSPAPLTFQPLLAPPSSPYSPTSPFFPASPFSTTSSLSSASPPPCQQEEALDLTVTKSTDRQPVVVKEEQFDFSQFYQTYQQIASRSAPLNLSPSYSLAPSPDH